MEDLGPSEGNGLLPGENVKAQGHLPQERLHLGGTRSRCVKLDNAANGKEEISKHSKVSP